MANGKGVDQQLSYAQNTATIESVNLADSDLTDAGIAPLTTLPRLRRLSMKGTLVTDDALEQLKEVETLEVLDISNTAISDAGVSHLTNHSNLKSLILSKDQVSPEAKEKLKNALPKLRFY